MSLTAQLTLIGHEESVISQSLDGRSAFQPETRVNCRPNRWPVAGHEDFVQT